METMMEILPTVTLYQAGQSPWLDYLSRDMLRSGKLGGLIEERGVLGVTSNPSIFQKAISQSDGSYEDDIRRLFRAGCSMLEVYDALTISDIQDACDSFKAVYNRTEGEHGYVSLEVLPNLAYQVERTFEDALRLWKRVDRPNVMIKVPATPEGIPAIQRLIGQGVNVNITLMFSLSHYLQVAHAYIEGLETLRARGGDIGSVRSVASVFVSRIDTFMDQQLEILKTKADSSKKKKELKSLFGQAAIANCKIIYQEFKRIFNSDQFLALQKNGAHVQKVLWGSTSAKNPSYPDLYYVETLVGHDTVNTMPQETLNALLDHGDIRENSIEENVPQAIETVLRLNSLGFDLTDIGEVLQKQGVKAFSNAFESLMRTLETVRERNAQKTAGLVPRDRYFLNPKDDSSITKHLGALQKKNVLTRFLNQDASLWKTEAAHQTVIHNRLGWLKAHEWMPGKFYELDQLQSEVQQESIKDVVLLGMGGSSLSPEVMSLICERLARSPRFRILDTTDPSAIGSLEKSLQLKKTLFVVASKSGSTIETSSQFHYFYERVSQAYGKSASADQAGSHFIAITDEGSPLEQTARIKKFRRCFVNPSNIGGRYSALSLFGLVPAALMGADYRDLVRGAAAFFDRTQEPDLEKNPGFRLGIAMGYFALQGRDKFTLLLSKSLSPFGAWLEQLIAESTGKEGKGVLPVEGEVFGNLSEYGKDRIFVALHLASDNDASFRTKLKTVRKAGFPLIEVEWPSFRSLGAEFLRWEIATAVACFPLRVNPFDEPNVKESKDITGRLLGNLKKRGRLELPKKLQSVKESLQLGPLLKKIRMGSYVVLLAYMERSPKFGRVLEPLRQQLRKVFRVPVLLGFGPRYLHSIGQFYKGGTRGGIFLEFLTRDPKDLKVPGTDYTFGQLKWAQALGDFTAIQKKGLPIAIVDLGKNPVSGFKQFHKQLILQIKETGAKGFQSKEFVKNG